MLPGNSKGIPLQVNESLIALGSTGVQTSESVSPGGAASESKSESESTEMGSLEFCIALLEALVRGAGAKN